MRYMSIGRFKIILTLRAAFEARLTTAMTASGIPVTKENKSLVLSFRPNMPGGAPSAQIQNACTYFLNTSPFRNILAAQSEAAAVVTKRTARKKRA